MVSKSQTFVTVVFCKLLFCCCCSCFCFFFSFLNFSFLFVFCFVCFVNLSVAQVSFLCIFQLLLDFNAETGMRRQSAYGLYFTVDPLQLAAAYQHYDCLKALLAAGAQVVSFSSFTGVFSPYHTLVRQSCGRRFAEILYEFGSTPWAKDAKGRFPWEMEPRGSGRDSESYQELMEFFDKVRGMHCSVVVSCCCSYENGVFVLNFDPDS